LGGEKLKTCCRALDRPAFQKNASCAFFAALIFFTLITPSLFAQETSVSETAVPAIASGEEAFVLGEEPAAVSGGGPASLGVVIRMVLVLALVALAIYGIVFFFKRISRPPQSKDPNLKILASAPLGSNRFVHVVSLGKQAWLIGAGDGGVNHIADIEDQETIETLLIEDAEKTGNGRVNTFASLLRRIGSAIAPAKGPQPEGFVQGDLLRKQRDRLKRL
jgi:flagellar protein FliO/FliZ